MKKGKVTKRCKSCRFWRRDWDWSKWNIGDERIMGECFIRPPVLCQTLIPQVIRETGTANMKGKREKFQMRPITEANDICAEHKKVKK